MQVQQIGGMGREVRPEGRQLHSSPLVPSIRDKVRPEGRQLHSTPLCLRSAVVLMLILNSYHPGELNLKSFQEALAKETVD